MTDNNRTWPRLAPIAAAFVILLGLAILGAVGFFLLEFSPNFHSKVRVNETSAQFRFRKPNALTDDEWTSVWQPTETAIVNVCPQNRRIADPLHERLVQIINDGVDPSSLNALWDHLYCIDPEYVDRWRPPWSEAILEVQRAVAARAQRWGD